MSFYIKANCITYKDVMYEKLFDHPGDMEWRRVINEYDYDYITDSKLIYTLDILWCVKELECDQC